MDKLVHDQRCKSQKCCLYIDHTLGARLIGFIDILSLTMCLLCGLRVISATKVSDDMGLDIDSVNSSLRLIYWIGVLLFIPRVIAFINFLRSQGNPDHKETTSARWWEIRIKTWALLAVVIFFWMIYALIVAPIGLFVLLLVDVSIKLAIDFHFCKTIQTVHDESL